jgi:hypothetical protein
MCVPCASCVLQVPLRQSDHSSRGGLPNLCHWVWWDATITNAIHLHCVVRRSQTKKERVRPKYGCIAWSLSPTHSLAVKRRDIYCMCYRVCLRVATICILVMGAVACGLQHYQDVIKLHSQPATAWAIRSSSTNLSPQGWVPGTAEYHSLYYPSCWRVDLLTLTT